jgi:NAD(P)H-nitrite reductase large subunit
VRAVTAAKLYLTGQAPSVAAAALSCGSCIAYVQAALVLLKSENVAMLERVLCGQVPLLVAAKQLKQVAALVDAYRAAAAVDRVAFARAVGPTVLFDDTLVPAI